MNLIEAIKSGRPFKRRHHEFWFAKYDGCESERFRPNEVGFCELLMGEVLADDWEIQEPTVTITRAQFWEAVYATLPQMRTDPDWRLTHEGVEKVARRLGLEP